MERGEALGSPPAGADWAQAASPALSRPIRRPRRSPLRSLCSPAIPISTHYLWLTPINHLSTPPVLDQVLRIHSLRRLKGGPADQQIGCSGEHFVAPVGADDF